MSEYRLKVLAGEPWCFPPDVLANMTDHTIETLYFAPRDDKGQVIPPAAPVEAAAEVTLPDRASFVAEAMGRFGKTAEHWQAQYDAWAAQAGAIRAGKG